MPRSAAPRRKENVSNPRLATLRKRVAQAPTAPGVYRWMDAEGTVLYVGKAKNLRNRLRSYVATRNAVGPWKQSFLEQIADFDVSVTNTEVEALIFETNLIKELRPKYNVLMKDDKNYIYAKVTNETFPRIEPARRIEEDGGQYFGPMATGGELWAMLTMLRSIFPFRTCGMGIEPSASDPSPSPLRRPSPACPERSRREERGHPLANSVPPPPPGEGVGGEGNSKDRIVFDVVCTRKDRPTPCLDHHIEKCCAPCIGTKTPAQYRAECIDGVVRFLKGDYDSVRPIFEERMRKAAVDKRFELAAQFRDYLAALDRLQSRQLVTDTSGEDSDIIAVGVLSGRADVVVMHRRSGRLIGDMSFSLAGQAEDAADVLAQFLPQYYGEGSEVPEEIIVSSSVPGRAVFEEWLTQKKGRRVRIVVPARGKKSHLLQLAEKNVLEKARQREAKWEAEQRNTASALAELQERLQLPALPERIEGYDISHLGGTETVGSMVVMIGGKARNDQYRSFTVRTLASGDVDDYASLREVLKRRLRRLTESLSEEERAWEEQGVSVGKARKAEQDTLQSMFGSPQGAETVEYREFIVARQDEKIIATARIHEHGERKVRQLMSLWVDDAWRGRKLGQFLVRKLLHGIKRGKVYIRCKPSLEEYYGDLGFRHVIKPPPAMQTTAEDDASVVFLWEASQHKPDPSLSARPDLLVIDGGKGQLGAALEVLALLQLDIPVCSLAKREEEVFVPEKTEAMGPGGAVAVAFPGEAPAKFLLMRLRDEAHRFANRHREKRGKKAAQGSVLDTIPGIGPEGRKKLLRTFGSLASIRAASDEQLREVLSELQVKELRRRIS